MTDIKTAKILIMSTHGFEQSELETPLNKLRDVGATVHVATLDGQEIRGWDKSDLGRSVPADLRIADADAADYDALVLPGGQINPDLLRVEHDAVDLVRAFEHSGKIIAAICHAPWLLIEAGIIKGREATSYSSISTDVKNAGAEWIDAPVVVSERIITSRNPDDLDAFVQTIIEEVETATTSSVAA